MESLTAVPQTVADGCERKRKTWRTQPHPQTPKGNGNPRYAFGKNSCRWRQPRQDRAVAADAEEGSGRHGAIRTKHRHLEIDHRKQPDSNVVFENMSDPLLNQKNNKSQQISTDLNNWISTNVEISQQISKKPFEDQKTATVQQPPAARVLPPRPAESAMVKINNIVGTFGE